MIFFFTSIKNFKHSTKKQLKQIFTEFNDQNVFQFFFQSYRTEQKIINNIIVQSKPIRLKANPISGTEAGLDRQRLLSQKEEETNSILQ